MNRKVHVRFGGGFVEKCLYGNSPHSHPTNTRRAISHLLLVLALLLPLVVACGAEPTPTSPPPTDTPRPAATSRPTNTVEPADTPAPEPTDTSEPADTPTPEPTDTSEPTPSQAASFEAAPCSFDLPAGQVEGETVECGYLRVPEDRADPESPTIRLAVATFYHPDGDPEPDPVLYLEGGPGGSALEFLSLTFAELSKPVFAANRDFVVFDQRGVGLSEPALDCPEVLELGRELLDWEVDGETITEQEATDLVLQTTLACGQALGQVADLSAYNTAANAADVNDLRLALGYDEVNLWGVSYGTHLALAVMRDHPEGLRSVVLDSVYPLDVDLYLEVLPNVDRAFDELFEGCAADETCNTNYPDLRTVFFETVNRLNETPASFQITDPFTGESYEVLLTGDDLVGLLHQFLYYTNVVPSLPQMIYDASQGTFDQAARILGLVIGTEETLSRGMFYSVRCHDELAFSTLDQFEAVAAEYPELARFLADGISSLSYGVCEDWDAGQAGAIENQAVTSDIPALILAGEYDPVTAPSWGKHAAATLENGYFFEYPGVGHGASVADDCPREMIVAFLDDPTAAPDDACIAEMDLPQFVVPVEAGAIELEPFTNEEMGIQGLVPAGWTEVNIGVYSRGSSATDTAVLLAQAAPVGAEDLLALVSSQLGLEEPPEAVGEREANGLTWTLYAVTVLGLELDLALTESNGLALIVLLQSDPGEHEALYEAVFLPVVDALVPTE
jgi:pimeloyl-ACP methyl ester carboxylesterase